jgi:uncharacterized protein (DUF488 family)
MSGASQLLTTGYAGHDLDTFVAKLREHGVEMIVDVRQNPVSRKRGFSKSKLEMFLAGHGISYVHQRELGVPAELRNRLRGGECKLDEYFSEFARYLSTQDAALAALQKRSTQERCCLICVESRPEDCHRSIVAEAISQRSGGKVRVNHI